MEGERETVLYTVLPLPLPLSSLFPSLSSLDISPFSSLDISLLFCQLIIKTIKERAFAISQQESASDAPKLHTRPKRHLSKKSQPARL